MTNGNGVNSDKKREHQNFEKRSVKFDKPPQDQMQNLDKMLGLVKNNEGNSTK